MTVESAVAIAGGFSPRARRDSVTLTHTDASGPRVSSCHPVLLSAPATPCSSASAGSDHASH
jgi:polysaccharide export outer membrane protein